MVVLTNLVACLLVLLISNEIIHTPVIAKENSPDVSVTRYKNEKTPAWVTIQWENSPPESIKKDGDDYNVEDTESISSILLTCRAPYPVIWVMTDVQPTLLNKIITNSKATFDGEDGNWTNVEAKDFTSYMEVYNDASFSGYREKAKTLLKKGEEIEIGLNGRESILIPCKVSKKNAVVSLSKKDEAGSWAPLSLKINFNPKKGFIVDKSEIEKLIGSYKCSVADPAEELIVNVVEEFHEELEFPIKTETYGNATWGPRKYGDGVECCSNSTKSPTLFILTCENIPECNMKKLSYLHLLPNIMSNTPGVYPTTGRPPPCRHTTGWFFGLPFLMQCIGEGINVSGQFGMEFGSINYDKMKFAPSTSIQNTTYNVETSIKVQVLMWENVTTAEGESVQRFDILDLNKGDVIFIGQRFAIECCGLHYHHAIGRLQRIVWKNGTITKLATPEKDRFDLESYAYMKDFCFNYIYDADNEGYLITADENMSHFECIVPRWYDKKAGMKMIPLNIKAPHEPVIISSADVVNVTYNENQVGLLLLECKLSAGLPLPQTIWTKDGYQLNQTDIYWSVIKGDPDQLSANLLFMRATKEIEGEYVCTMVNWKGMDEKTFIVKVNPRSYLDYWLALVIFGGFFAIIICCALRISTLEKQTAPKQVEPLSTRHEN